MTIQTDVGPVFWHDLLTPNVDVAMRFYAELLGWKYQIEHSSDFVWHPGEADYPLIMVDGQAHGGFVDRGQEAVSGWIAYIKVDDVDAVTDKAKVLGAVVERAPFDIPGVGRSAVIRDLQGAIICPAAPSYDLPAPVGAFLQDELNTEDVGTAESFYRSWLGWQVPDTEGAASLYGVRSSTIGETDAVRIVKRSLTKVSSAMWLPYLATEDIESTIANAKTLGASVTLEQVGTANTDPFAILSHPLGGTFGLLAFSKPGER